MLTWLAISKHQLKSLQQMMELVLSRMYILKAIFVLEHAFFFIYSRTDCDNSDLKAL
jgi:hypothetical protein